MHYHTLKNNTKDEREEKQQMGNSSSRTIQFPNNKLSQAHQPPHRFLFKFSNNVLNVPPICEEFHGVNISLNLW